MDRRPDIPLASLVLGFGPVLLLAGMAALAWLLPPWRGVAIMVGAQLWGAAILIFLAGVTRGLSFDAPDGAPPMQIARMMLLFVLGLAGLALFPTIGFPLLAVGYGIVGVADARAARAGRAPAHFARLRPPQMAIAVAAVAALVALALRAALLR